MKAFILAAGLGTRLRPWTLTHPKALVRVGGVPMLQRVIERLRAEGFTDIIINVHHFASQVEEFLAARDFGVNISISDERAMLLDTGGALLHARRLICGAPGPVLVHNVDILSDAPLRSLMQGHIATGAAATLLTSPRRSSRQLIFSGERLCGWHNLSTGVYKPGGFRPAPGMAGEAFSGIHVISPELIERMPEMGFTGRFSIIDFYLAAARNKIIRRESAPHLQLIDIGKPETLALARQLFQR